MPLFHRHTWVEKDRVMAPPCERDFRTKGSAPVAFMERLALGVTTIVYECACGKLQTIETLGVTRCQGRP